MRVTLRPAPADAGIIFRRVDRPAGPPAPDGEGANEIRLTPDAVCDTRLGTTIANAHGATVQTVEHLLAAVVGLGLDNVWIDIDGPEVPAMDGSAAPFANLIARVGLDLLDAPRRVIRILKTVEVALDDRSARFEPAPRTEIDVVIDFDDSAIGRQHASFTLDAGRFARDVAPARTFAFQHEVDGLREAGLALGGSLGNCIVLDGGEVLNKDGLRFADEFVRHKALDALGDLALAGRPIVGRYVAERPGHALNSKALKALMSDPDAWTLESAAPTSAADAPTRPASDRAGASADEGLLGDTRATRGRSDAVRPARA